MQFTICTDHDSLCWILNLANTTGRLARLRLRLSEFHSDNVVRLEIKHQMATVLSRLRKEGVDNSPLEDELPVLLLEQEDLPHKSYSTVFVFDADASLPVHIVDAVDETKVLAPTLAEFITAQAADRFSHSTARQLGQEGTQFMINMEDVVVFREPIDGAR